MSQLPSRRRSSSAFNDDTTVFKSHVRDTSHSIDKLYQDILDNIINEEYIQQLYPNKNLQTLKFVSLTIDSTNQSIFELHHILPCLESLELDNSRIASIRDLGVGLRCLTRLSLVGCGLHDLDGIGVLMGLEHLNVDNNYLTEVYPLAMHDGLKELRLCDNNISDLSIADTLSTCPNLRSLHLQGNLISKIPQYHLIVSSMVSQLHYIDGITTDSNASNLVTNAMILEAASILSTMENSKTTTRKNASETKDSLEASFGQSKSLLSDRGSASIHDPGSELTHGSDVVMAGSVASAMRRRRNSTKTDNDQSNRRTSTSTAMDLFDSVFSKTGSDSARSSIDETTAMTKISCFREGDITDFMTNRDSYNFDHLNAKSSPMKRPITAQPSKSSSISSDKAEKSNNNLEESSNFKPITSALLPSDLKNSLNSISSIKRSSNASEEDDIETLRSRLSSRSGFRSGVTMPQYNHISDDPSVSVPRPRTSYVTPSRQGRSHVMMDVVRRNAGDMYQFEINDDNDSDSNHGSGSETGRSSGSKLKCNIEFYGNDDCDAKDEDSDSDHEMSVVSHATRHLMSAKGRRPSTTGNMHGKSADASHSSNSTAHNKSEAANTAVKLRSDAKYPTKIVNNKDFYEVDGRPPSGLSRPSTGESRRSDTNSRESKSSLVGKVLGFDLHGSLAAIEKWAGQIDSSSDDDEGVALQKTNDYNDNIVAANDIDSDTDNSSFRHLIDSGNILSVPRRPDVGKDSNARNYQRIHRSPVKKMNPTALLLTPLQHQEPSEVENKDMTSTILHREKIISMFANGGKVESPNTVIDKSATKSPTEPENNSPHDKDPEKRKRHGDNPHKPINLFEKITGHQEQNKNQTCNINQNAEIELETIGEGVRLSDCELIAMLQKPPKTIPQLRTRSSFQNFFKGMDLRRMEKLLETAYSDISNEIEKREKVLKRLELLTS